MAQKTISGKEFDKPLIIHGGVTGEPEKYIAEKPYDLTKYEYSLLRKGFGSDLLSKSVFAATVGFTIAVIGKVISALINKESPTLEKWEIWAILIGVIVFLLLKIKKIFLKTDEEKEFKDINTNIVEHFESHLKRRVHVTKEKEGE